ncbi:hypothetical protein DB29_00283 [Shouchella clausii]|nr:hypothetical protein DB29_00283 [Shouchella clausii]
MWDAKRRGMLLVELLLGETICRYAVWNGYGYFKVVWNASFT